MAWRKLPVITKNKVQYQLVNLDHIAYFRTWGKDDEKDEDSGGSVGYSPSGNLTRIDKSLEELENELDIHTASQKV